MQYLNKKDLAYYSGAKVIKKKFKEYNSIGIEELKAAKKVIKSGKLSSFIGGNLEGGFYVQKLEKYLEKFYKVKHVVSVNSWTSGLICAVGALDIEPGDEIITTPWSMCASATSILHWNAIPVFADISKKDFCIDPNSIRDKISRKTKAILAVDIFGRSCKIDEIKRIIMGTNIKIITDSAQSPYSLYQNKITGTISDVGGFSLNYHKHIHTGEGGILVTNDSVIAQRLKLIRNHAEAYSKFKKNFDLQNMLGFNFRMGEIEASIGIEQYKKLKNILKKRNKILNFLTLNLKNLKGLELPEINLDFNHNFYIYPLVLDLGKIPYSRKFIFKCLQAEGVQGLNEGYSNIHLLPLFQKKIAYGKSGFPWSVYNKHINYKKGICPNAEELHEKSFLGIEVCLFDLSEKDVLNIAHAFKKVWKCLGIY